MKCNSIQTRTIPQSTRLQLENENTKGNNFRWKSNHVKMTKPIRTVSKLETTDKEDTDRMTTVKFPATLSQFKEGIRPINESKALEWLDAKSKLKNSTSQVMTDQKWLKLETTGMKKKQQK